MKQPKEHCPWCDTKKALTKKGTFRWHGSAPGRDEPCRGSGRFPSDGRKAFEAYDAACTEQDEKKKKNR